MANTTPLTLAVIADWHNLAWALRRAARGKHRSPTVRAALRRPEATIARIGEALRDARLPVGHYRSFIIHDPKRREIHAADFLDRVAHHAIVRFVEPVFERVLLPTVFACRTGKGAQAAIYHAQRQARRFAWVMHLDIEHYFPSIEHELLRAQARRRLRGDAMPLLDVVIDSYSASAGRGLPIGALTSQHFANHYLNDADRWCLAQPGVRAHARYMDDFLFWADDKQALLRLRSILMRYLQEELRLCIKPPLIQRSAHGILFCGVRVKPFALRPSQRRRRRYRQAVSRWEGCWRRGEIDGLALQRGYDAARAILLPADDMPWRVRCLARAGGADA